MREYKGMHERHEIIPCDEKSKFRELGRQEKREIEAVVVLVQATASEVRLAPKGVERGSSSSI